MTPQATVEREVKLGVWPGFELPDLRGTLNGTAASAPEELRLEAAREAIHATNLLGRARPRRRSQSSLTTMTAHGSADVKSLINDRRILIAAINVDPAAIIGTARTLRGQRRVAAGR